MPKQGESTGVIHIQEVIPANVPITEADWDKDETKRAYFSIPAEYTAAERDAAAEAKRRDIARRLAASVKQANRAAGQLAPRKPPKIGKYFTIPQPDEDEA